MIGCLLSSDVLQGYRDVLVETDQNSIAFGAAAE